MAQALLDASSVSCLTVIVSLGTVIAVINKDANNNPTRTNSGTGDSSTAFSQEDVDQRSVVAQFENPTPER